MIKKKLIKTGWWFSELPKYRELSNPHTYNCFLYDKLPQLSVMLDNDFTWLKVLPKLESSMYEVGYPDGTLPDLNKIDKIEADLDIPLPYEFRTFIKSPDLHQRIRSNTDCYFDIHDFAIRTYGAYDGYLIHFLSDSQWCLHWYIELLKSGEHFVVVSSDAYGLESLEYSEEEDNQETTYNKRDIDLAKESDFLFCSENFTEFIYRFWLENEIWFALARDNKPLTDKQLQYVNQYK